MHTRALPLRWAVAAALALPCVLAQAAPAGSASAAIQQFSIQLIDLDPNDNVTPALTITDSTLSSEARYFSWEGGQADLIDVAGSTRLANAHGEAAGATGPDGVRSVSRILDAGNPSPYTFSVESEYAASFTVTPNTALLMTALGSISLAEDGPDVQGSALLNLTASLFDNTFPWSGYQVAVDESRTDDPGSRILGLSAYLYNGNSSATGNLRLWTVSSISAPPSTVSPVPEPASYGMLLVGAAVVAAARRRARA